VRIPRWGRPLNPVLARELKERMRRKRSGFVLTVYLVLLSGALWLLYLGASAAGADGPGVLRLASLGRAAFQTLLFAMLILVCFIVPGLAAGGVAGERERQTLVPLQVTLLRPSSILFGKLAASLAFVVFLVVAALPLIGVSFLLGGVEPGEVVRGVGMVLAVATTVAALALTCSTLMRRVQGATVLSYALVAFLIGGTFIAFGAEMLVDRKGPRGRSQLILALNPLVATADVVSRVPDSDSRVPSPFTPLQSLIDERKKPKDDLVNSMVGNAWAVTVESGVAGVANFGDGGFVMKPGPDGIPLPVDGNLAVAQAAKFRPPFLNRIPMWALALAGYTLLSLGGLALAARKLATPAAGER
jgi:ABC-type transport system involved in multi-copper enzyme maturation permease subunit